MLADLPVTDTVPTVAADADVATGPLAYGRSVTASACLELDLEHETRLALRVDTD